MTIVITGGIGEGKTIYASYLAHKIAKENNMNIRANYALKGRIETNEEMTLGSVIVIDEAQNMSPIFTTDEDVLILVVQHLKFLENGKYDEITVKKEGGKIIASNGDEILIEEYKDLYDAFIPSTPYIV